MLCYTLGVKVAWCSGYIIFNSLQKQLALSSSPTSLSLFEGVSEVAYKGVFFDTFDGFLLGTSECVFDGVFDGAFDGVFGGVFDGAYSWKRTYTGNAVH